jgi:hypothetical protein
LFGEDRRAAIRLARLHRAGELTPVQVPAEAEEAVRDLVRARAALLADRKRAQQRITAMLMRHGRIWRSGSYWTLAHEKWIAAQRFDEPALAAALAHYRAALDTRRAELDAIEAELEPWATRPPLAGGSRGWAATAASPTSPAWPWPPRWSTGGGSRRRGRSWASPGWCPPSTPAAS